MARITTQSGKSTDREQLRRELLKLIVKNEATRRESSKAQEK